MAYVLTVDDLPAKVREAVEPSVLVAMVAGVNARASRVAPCLAGNPDPGLVDEARLILMGAVQRWSEAGSGALVQRQDTMGPFSHGESYDTRQRTGFALWPSEIKQLQDICRAAGGAQESPKVFTVETGRRRPIVHSPYCDRMFAGAACSCGSSVNRFEGPIPEFYEMP